MGASYDSAVTKPLDAEDWVSMRRHRVHQPAHRRDLPLSAQIHKPPELRATDPRSPQTELGSSMNGRIHD